MEENMTPNDTDRLHFRELEDSDFDAVHSYASDPEVCTYMEWGPNTPEQTREFIARCKEEADRTPRSGWNFAIIRKEDGRLIGGCNVTITSAAYRRADIGYCFHRDAWRNGYATETARALIAFGFERLGLEHVCATCRPENIGSARALEKAGMSLKGTLSKAKLLRGAWHDSRIYGITRTP